MKLKSGELRVYYSGDLIDTGIEEAIEKVVESYGMKFWASGMDMETNVRDVCYEKKPFHIEERIWQGTKG